MNKEFKTFVAGETEVWLDIAKDARYLSIEKYQKLSENYDEVNRMLFGMTEKPERFCMKASRGS